MERYVLYSSARQGFLAGLGVNPEGKIVPLITANLDEEKIIRFVAEDDINITLETLQAWTGVDFADFEVLVYKTPPVAGGNPGVTETAKAIAEKLARHAERLCIRI